MAAEWRSSMLGTKNRTAGTALVMFGQVREHSIMCRAERNAANVAGCQ
jgi:hypothetical protein